ncbi:MAG: MBL fold metallo-hydrolase [Acidobacteriota bacterium]
MKSLFKGICLLEAPEFKFPECNCLLIEDEVLCLVDTSASEAEFDQIKDRPIQMIVNSHGHPDHVLHNKDFSGAQIYLHEADHHLLTGKEEFLRTFGFDLYHDDIIRPLYADAVGYYEMLVNHAIVEGQRINVGTIGFDVMHTPGHSAGHCCFTFPREGFVFTGDITGDMFGPWYGTLDSDIDQFIESINRLIDLGPDIIVPGHGARPLTSKVGKRMADYRDKLYLREEEIIKVMFSGKNTVEEIASERPIYKEFPEPKLIFFHYESMMVWHHVNRLVRMGRVNKEGERYYLKEGITPRNLQLG